MNLSKPPRGGIPVPSKLPTRSTTGAIPKTSATNSILKSEQLVVETSRKRNGDEAEGTNQMALEAKRVRIEGATLKPANTKPAKRKSFSVRRKTNSMASKMTKLSQQPRFPTNRGTVSSKPKASPRKSAKQTATSSKENVVRNVTNTVPSRQESHLQPKATNRPKWDIKGQLQDAIEIKNKLIQEKNGLIISLKQVTEERDNLIEKNRSKTEKCDSLESTLEETQTRLSNLETEMPLLKNKLAELEELLINKNSELKSVNQKYDLVKNQYDELKIGSEASNVLLKETTEKNNILNRELAKLKSKCTVLEDDLQKLEILRRTLHNQILELKGNIRVFCRVRPFISSEPDSGIMDHIQFIENNTILITKPAEGENKMKNLPPLEFSLDQVFKPSIQQAEVFEEISQLVQSVLDGYNVCIFAYGQTGSGKTFTMEGPSHIQDFNKDSNNCMLGVIPRAVQQVFSVAENLKLKGWEYKMNVSVVEIYNEVINDLLQSKSDCSTSNSVSQTSIKLNETKDGNTMLSNLVVYTVHSERDVYKLLKQARKKRATAATSSNDHSSRSHSVFMLHLTGKNIGTGESLEGTLNLVDLAGSEKYENNSEVDRKKETININKSLSNLGNVIMALSQNADHIPYRNSKLTHLLKNSLGGNSKTLMFVNISPRIDCIPESISSLRFATKVNSCNIGTARKIKS